MASKAAERRVLKEAFEKLAQRQEDERRREMEFEAQRRKDLEADNKRASDLSKRENDLKAKEEAFDKTSKDLELGKAIRLIAKVWHDEMIQAYYGRNARGWRW